ncbi:MAG: DUF6036 family nucleotidyltransferase [Thermodesulfobacteriota bacterium]
MDDKEIVSYLRHLAGVYDALKGVPLEVIICGGAALNLLGYVRRVTKDIDIVSPEVLPSTFTEAAKITADYFGLTPEWINQGPVDLLRMGLPEGFYARCQQLDFHSHLIFLLTSRFDQIHFKLYASVDRGGYHLQDLKALDPTNEELATAVAWCFTHDVSEPFKEIMKDFLLKNGWKDAAHIVFP